MSGFAIAIDGPAASGKGTLSKRLAKHFGFAHLDTGLLYRAVAKGTLEGVAPLEAAKNLTAKSLEQEGLRTPEVAQAASKVATLPEVRAALVDFQRAFARREGGAILDGRDIGTVICPEAKIKLFVVASAEVRAQRRFEELREKDLDVTFESVFEDVKVRDARDSERSEAPLKPAADAIIIDTSEMSIDEAFRLILDHIQARSEID